MRTATNAHSLGQASKVTTRPAAPDPAVPFATSALDLEYPLLGPRTYTHGSSMLEGMLAAVRTIVPDLDSSDAVIRQFKVIRQFDTLARAEAMASADATHHLRIRDAVARLDVRVGNERLTSLLFPKPEPAKGRLADYDPDGYLAAIGPASATAPAWGQFADVTDFIELVRGLNECNRQLTVASFPTAGWSKRVRWAYIQGLPVLGAEACRTIRLVTYTYPETVDLGHRQRFEIKTGKLIGDEARHTFKICFFIELPEDRAS